MAMTAASLQFNTNLFGGVKIVCDGQANRTRKPILKAYKQRK